MRKILFLLIMLMSFAFSANTNWVGMRVADVYTRTIPLSLGAALATELDSVTTPDASSVTLSVLATTGRGELPQIMTLRNAYSGTNLVSPNGSAITTIDVIVITTMSIGDIVILQTGIASEDVVVVDDGSTIFLGAATRLLSGLSDDLWLRKFSATALKEVGFYDNE